LNDSLKPVAVELLGVDPIAGIDGLDLPGSGECRLRLAAIAEERAAAARLGEEVTALYTNGPAGGGGVRVSISDLIGVASTSLERSRLKPSVVLFDSAAIEPAS
jgi:hypothetical protein